MALSNVGEILRDQRGDLCWAVETLSDDDQKSNSATFSAYSRHCDDDGGEKSSAATHSAWPLTDDDDDDDDKSSRSMDHTAQSLSASCLGKQLGPEQRRSTGIAEARTGLSTHYQDSIISLCVRIRGSCRSPHGVKFESHAGSSCSSSSCNGRMTLPTVTFLQKYLDCPLDISWEGWRK
jgi:hypothetical protein